MSDPATRFWDLWQQFQGEFVLPRVLLDKRLEEELAAARFAVEEQEQRDIELVRKFDRELKNYPPFDGASKETEQPATVLAPLRSKATKAKNRSSSQVLYSEEMFENSLATLEQLRLSKSEGTLGWRGCGWGCSGFLIVGISTEILVGHALGGFPLFAAGVALLVGALYPLWSFEKINVEMGDLAVETFEQLQDWSRVLQSERATARGAAEAVVRNRHKREVEILEKKFEQIFHAFVAFKVELGLYGGSWSHPEWLGLEPPSERIPVLRVGAANLPLDQDIPVVIPWRALVLEQYVDHERQEVLRQLITSLLFRFLTCLPPGKLRFLFIDPLGLGENVAHFMPLANHDPELISHRAWSDPHHIEKQLQEWTEHVEVVIQKYLQAEYRTLEEYNEKAGEIAEPYRVLVYFDYPAGLTSESARRMVSLVKHGPRCGVIPIILRNHAYHRELKELADFEGDYANGAAVGDGRVLIFPTAIDSTFQKQLSGEPPFVLVDDIGSPQLAPLIDHLIATFGAKAKAGKHVEVAFDKVHGDNAEWWTGDSRNGVSVPLGPSGARKVQHFTLGTGMSHHALIIGRSRSGKSNLMHVIISGIARIYPPSEVQLALIDFKKGVEFKSYANLPLPHAKVIAIESEREFGLSVLEGVDRELHERGELFRAQGGAQNLADYREASGEKMPRYIILVDEFQEFFTGDDSLSQRCVSLMDRIVRQGAAFGIHLILGSQSLAGVAGPHRGMLDQMNVRIALQCSDADSRLVLAEDNPQAHFLSRPGEGIYNDAGGLVEGNHKFQGALFSKEDRGKHFEALRKLMAKTNCAKPVIFEGHEPARLETCAPLLEALSKGPRENLKAADAWVGDPLAIRPPTAVRLQRRSGCNLMVIHRDEAAGCGVLQALLLGLSVQLPPESATFHIVDFARQDGPYAKLADSLKNLLPHTVNILGRRDLQGMLQQGVEEINARHADRERATKSRSEFLVFLGFQQARDLRQSDDFGGYGYDRDTPTLPKLFSEFVREGPDVGFHTLLWCDTVANLMKALDRRSLNEFNARIVGPLSAQDSLTLVDDPAASKLDRPNRMIFLDEDKPGVLETFRPYSLVSEEKLRELLDTTPPPQNVPCG